MAKIVYCHLILLLIIRSDVETASSCNKEVPDKNLNLILSDGGLNFGLNLYKELKDEKNVFFSPFSVRVALAMTSAGAGGTTLSQMNKALALEGFRSEDQMKRAFQSDLSSFCPNSNYALSTANRIYIKNDFSITKPFKKSLKKYFLSRVKNANFGSDPVGTAKSINRWVGKQTNGTINDLISPGSLSPETVLVLVNAIYFKGKWKTRFDAKNTKPQTFNLADGRKVEVPTMYAESDFKYTYSRDLKSQVLQMDYDGDRLAMHIILPEKGTSLSSVQQKLNSTNVNEYIDSLFLEELKVYLPKFKANYKNDLKEPLRSLGMSEVFGNSADLSRMTSAGPLRVSNVVHQAFVAVDEKGTTAAAATGVVAVPMSASYEPPKPIEFRVDRPCVYLIYDLKFKQILFMGNLDDPSSYPEKNLKLQHIFQRFDPIFSMKTKKK